MNYAYLYSAIMMVNVMGAHAMNKNSRNKGIAQPATSMAVVLEEDASHRTQDFLLLKCAFATFVESVEKKRQMLEGLNKELESPNDSPNKVAALSLIQETLHTLQAEVQTSKLLLTQNSGGCPTTPPSSPTNDCPLFE